MSELHELIGKKVVAVRGDRQIDTRAKHPSIEARYILFNDEKTYIELGKQDYNYHDCASFARIITVRKDIDSWKRILEDPREYPEATEDP